MSRTDPSYSALNTRWDRDAARAAYDATPPCRFAFAFWTSLAADLGRTTDAVHRQLHVRWGWPPKVVVPMRPPRKPAVRRCACGGWRRLPDARCRTCSRRKNGVET